MVKMKEKKTVSDSMFIPVFPAVISSSFIVSIHILIKTFKWRTIDKKYYWLFLEVKAMFLRETYILLLDMAFAALSCNLLCVSTACKPELQLSCWYPLSEDGWNSHITHLKISSYLAKFCINLGKYMTARRLIQSEVCGSRPTNVYLSEYYNSSILF